MLRGANSIPNGIISSNLFILRNDAIRDHIPRSTSACNYAYCTVHTASLNKNSRLQVFTRVSKCLNTILCTSNIRGYYRTPYVGLTMVTKWLPHAVVYSTEIHFSSYISTWCLKHLWGLKNRLMKPEVWGDSAKLFMQLSSFCQIRVRVTWFIFWPTNLIPTRLHYGCRVDLLGPIRCRKGMDRRNVSAVRILLRAPCSISEDAILIAPRS
jgi:hypothetical protein